MSFIVLFMWLSCLLIVLFTILFTCFDCSSNAGIVNLKHSLPRPLQCLSISPLQDAIDDFHVLILTFSLFSSHSISLRLALQQFPYMTDVAFSSSMKYQCHKRWLWLVGWPDGEFKIHLKPVHPSTVRCPHPLSAGAFSSLQFVALSRFIPLSSCWSRTPQSRMTRHSSRFLNFRSHSGASPSI